MVADLLNLKSLRSEPPPALERVYQPEDYRKSQEYIRTNTRFALVTSTFSLVVLLSFWFAGGFDYLDQ
ncbi:MAG TPA: M48 family peptidase, partial [Dehalococcoidia bacterium]|nr:M48 family peptidase [Dehalococcoidia bacterium]